MGKKNIIDEVVFDLYYKLTYNQIFSVHNFNVKTSNKELKCIHQIH